MQTLLMYDQRTLGDLDYSLGFKDLSKEHSLPRVDQKVDNMQIKMHEHQNAMWFS